MATLMGWMSWLLMVASVFIVQLDGLWFAIPMMIAAICNGIAIYMENEMQDRIKRLEKQVVELNDGTK